MLDYTRDKCVYESMILDIFLMNNLTIRSNFLVWTRAASNQHYLVAAASLMGIVCLCFQPLAAALLVVRPTWIQLPGMS